MRILRSLGFLMLAGLLLGMAMPAPSQAQIAVGVSIRIGPPVLPVYAQPICPAPGYIWTPGYWAYGEDGYYWVPGTWVMAPEPGFLWTPGYWGFSEGVYVWHGGYWGPHVGFYGGINYGYGYTGVGFWGGEWRGREFVYNRSVTNVNTTIIHNTYNKTVIVNNTTINNVSYNGGPRGIQARPSERERIAEHDHHIEARHEQIEHEHAARADRRQWASENHGRPAVAASGRPGDFHRDVVATREASHREAIRSDRPDRGADNRGFARNDRASNAGGRDTGRFGGNDRPNSSHVDNRRDDRAVQDSHGRGPDPRGEARGNSHVDRGPAMADHGNPHADRGPSQHGPDHGSASHGNEGHGNSGHADNRPDHNKADHGKP